MIFVHGLGGSLQTTWIAKTKPAGLWPQWLEADVPDIAIWGVDYDAAPTRWRGWSMHLFHRAENVLARLLAEPRLQHGHLMFVAHSMGGLVVKQILRSADAKHLAHPRAADLLRRVRRVAFLATPHQGSGLATLANYLRILVLPSSAVASMVRNDPWLQDLNFWYRTYSDAHAIQNLVLVENWGTGPFGLVVKPDSSDPGLAAVQPIPIDATHRGITKLSARSSQVYVHVRDFISLPVSSAHRDAFLAEKIECQSAAIESLRASAQDNTQQVVASLNALERTLLEKAATVGQTAASSEFADAEITRRVIAIRQTRFLEGFDASATANAFATELLSGLLVSGSAKARANGLAWCARLLAYADTTRATSLLQMARGLPQDDTADIVAAVLLAAGGDVASALDKLGGIGSPQSRSAAFAIMLRAQGATAAISWLGDAGLSANALDPDGRLFLVASHLEANRWNEALEVVASLAEADFEQSPGLLSRAGDTHLAQATAPELRPFIVESLLWDVGFSLASDTQALAHRRTAQAFYERMAEKARSLGCTESEDRASDRALWLALQDPSERAKARDVLTASMRDRRTSLRRLPLAFQCGLALDHAAIESEIDQETALTGGKSREAAIARFAFALAKATPRDSAEYIARHRQQLAAHLDQRALSYVEVELLSKSGQLLEAERRVEELKSVGLSAEDVANLRRIISHSSGSDPAEEPLSEFSRTDSLADLRAAVDALEQQQDWERLAPLARTLFDRTHDLSDMKRCARSLYEVGDAPQLLELLRAFPEFINQAEILERSHCWALYNCGELLAADAALKCLIAKSANPVDRQMAVAVAIASGNWEALSVFVEEEWAARRERNPTELLRAAYVAQRLGSPRAQELATEAASQGADDASILLGCYSIAGRGGWEATEAVSQWLQRAAALSDEHGPVQQMSLKQVVDAKPDWDRREQAAWEQLEAGALPIFLGAKLLNRSLASLFVSPALVNLDEPDPRRRGLIFAFSGARVPSQLEPKAIALDATTLLTTALLDITEQVLAAFDRITIPHTTLLLLWEERDQLSFHQPSRVSDALELRQLIAAKRLDRFDRPAAIDADLAAEVGDGLAALLATATADHGDDTRQHLVVRPGPVHRTASFMEEEADLSAYAAHVCGCLAVVEKLKQKGQLTAAEEEHARSYLSLHERPWPKPPAISDGAVIYLDSIAVTYLQHLKLLGKLTPAGLTAVVAEDEATDRDALIAYEARATRAVEIVDGLRRRLRDGIQSGKIKVGVLPRQEPPDAGDTGLQVAAHPTTALLALAVDADAVVSDDRFINQHPHVDVPGGQTPILATLDILDILNRKCVLNPAQVREARTLLRRSGMQLVPVAEEELEVLLGAAQVVDGKLQESAEMRAIRESVQRLRMTDVLQLPKELPWLNKLERASFGALGAQWQEGCDESIASARSDWLLEMLDIRGWAHRFSGLSREAALQARRAQLMALVVLASSSSVPVRMAYWKWLESRLITPIKTQEPELYEWVVQQSRQMIDNVLAQQDSARDGE